jgi:hypothetical protein
MGVSDPDRSFPMTAKRSLIPALALTSAIAGGLVGVGVPSMHAAAQGMGMPGRPPAGMPHRLQHDGHIEGHIAFLKAELKITPAQEALFANVAAAMRDDVKEFEQAGQQRTAKGERPRTAVQILELRANAAALSAKTEDRFLAAFRPLYESLSAEQKQIADGLLAERDMR